jgi:uncharacterized protein with NAD-binding domain and iron-sulfur cluster
MPKKVIILGGGVAGMSAAHELIERGFAVEVYEKHRLYAGGKARSVNVPGTNKLAHDKYLPGEHGFRFFPGFYKHIVDTMKRIPYKNQKLGVFENLVPVNRVGLFRKGKEPIQTIVNFPQSFTDVEEIIHSMHADTGLTFEEKRFFARKVWQLMTTCYERRLNEYEKIGWWEYLQADNFSENYQALLVQGLTRTLVAANAKKASTKTGGDIFLQLIFNMSNPGVHTDRVLNGPTNDVWINPWLEFLQSQGVNYHFNFSAREIQMVNNKIGGVWVEKYQNGVPERTLVTGDYYLFATPVEVMAKLLSDDVLKADSTLGGIKTLAESVAWMNGIQFYLSEEVNIVHGHCIYADSPWALTSISQLPFWQDYDIQNRFNGQVKTIFSVDISDWEEPGILEATGQKTAQNCTYAEIKKEVWAQLKQSLNVGGAEILRDDQIIHWFIDHDITVSPQHDKTLPREKDINKEPLLVNTINSWGLRPDAYTLIPNLYLASDYVRTYTDLATMEGANEAARRAVNAIIEASDVKAPHCEIWNLHEPGILAELRHRDQKRYEKGLPYQFHIPLALNLLQKAISFASKIYRRFKG